MTWTSQVRRDDPWAYWLMLEGQGFPSDPNTHLFRDALSGRALQRYSGSIYDSFGFSYVGAAGVGVGVLGEQPIGMITGRSRMVTTEDFVEDEITLQLGVSLTTTLSASYALMALGPATGTGEPSVASQNAVLYWDSARKLNWWVDGVKITSPAAVTRGLVHASVGPAGMRLYVDGVLVASSSSKVALPGGPQRVWIRKAKADATLGLGVQPDIATGIHLPAVYAHQLDDAAVVRQWRVRYSRYGTATRLTWEKPIRRFGLDGTTETRGTITGTVQTDQDPLLGQPGRSWRFTDAGRLVLDDTYTPYADGLPYQFSPNGTRMWLSVLIRPERTTGWNLITGYGIGRDLAFPGNGQPPKLNWGLYVANGRIVWRQEGVRETDGQVRDAVTFTHSDAGSTILANQEYVVTLSYFVDTSVSGSRPLAMTIAVNDIVQTFTDTQAVRLGTAAGISGPKWSIGALVGNVDPFLGRIDDLTIVTDTGDYYPYPYVETMVRASYPALDDPGVEVDGVSQGLVLVAPDGLGEQVEVDLVEADGTSQSVSLVGHAGTTETEAGGGIQMPIQTDLGRESAAAGFVAVATHMSLHSGPPGQFFTLEIEGGAYVRQPVTWDAGAVDGSYSASVPAPFDVDEGWTVTHVGLWNADVDGDIIDWTELDTPAQFDSAGTLEITNIVFTMA